MCVSSRQRLGTARACGRWGAVASLVFTLLLSGLSRQARAYCRESLTSPLGGACVDGPDAQYLFWTRGCFSYVFNAQTFERVRGGEPVVRRAFDAAFRAWTDVPCDGREPFFVEQNASVTTSSETSFEWGQVNESVIVVRTAEQWANEADHDPRAVALTLLWYSKKTAEIMDFDMELNGGRGQFADCVVSACSQGMIDLQNAVTHEAGHVFGLAHSADPNATMHASTPAAPETSKRTLEPDDERGYCALDLPGFSCDETPCRCPAPPVYNRSSGGCGCRLHAGAPARSAAMVGSLLAVFGLWLRARRRPRKPPR